MEVDLNFDRLTKNEIIQKYLENLQRIRLTALTNHSFTSFEFDQILWERYFNNVNTLRTTSQIVVKAVLDRRRKILMYAVTVFVAFVVCIQYRSEASSVILRNVQNLIYPGMKIWRKITLPIITKFPGLTELYDESCLVTNPFFQIEGMDCTPCADVVNVLDLTGAPHFIGHNPFIFKTTQPPVDLRTLFNWYKEHELILKQDAYRVQSSSKMVKNLDDLFREHLNRTHDLQSHTMWRCNRMEPARALRQLFPRPSRLPANGIALERFLAIDTIGAPPYPMPDTECSNMFAIQVAGVRTVVLRPTSECRHKCRTVSVRLPPSYVLQYDWWYWKPVSVPDQYQTQLPSMTYIGSYC